jgi:hypothetical protein
MTWHKYSDTDSSRQYGELWDIGDVIGVCIDLDECTISFYQNGKYLGEAYNGIEVGPNKAYFPGMSLVRGQRVEFNFGAMKMMYDYDGYQPMDIPESIYRETYDIAEKLLAIVKQYTLPFLKLKDTSYHYKINITYRIFTYLSTLLRDKYILQEAFFPFLSQLENDQIGIFFENLIMYENEKGKTDLVTIIFDSLCKLIEKLSITPKLFNEWQKYFDLFKKLLGCDGLVQEWLNGSRFEENIKSVFSWDYARVNDISRIYAITKQSGTKDVLFKHFHKQVIQSYYESDSQIVNEQIAASKFIGLINYCMDDTRTFKRGKSLKKLIFEGYLKRVELRESHFYHRHIYSDDMFIKNLYINSLNLVNAVLEPSNYANFTIEPFVKRNNFQSLYYDMLGIGGTISHVTNEYLDNLSEEFTKQNDGKQNTLLHYVLNMSVKYIQPAFYEINENLKIEDDRTLENFETNRKGLKNVYFRKLISVFTYRNRKVSYLPNFRYYITLL